MQLLSLTRGREGDRKKFLVCMIANIETFRFKDEDAGLRVRDFSGILKL